MTHSTESLTVDPRQSAWVAQHDRLHRSRVRTVAAVLAGIVGLSVVMGLVAGATAVLLMCVPLLGPAVLALRARKERDWTRAQEALGANVGAWPSWTLRTKGLDHWARRYVRASVPGSRQVLDQALVAGVGAEELHALAARVSPAILVRPTATPAPESDLRAAKGSRAKRLELARRLLVDPAAIDVIMRHEVESAVELLRARKRVYEPVLTGPESEVLVALLSRHDLTQEQQSYLLGESFAHLFSTDALGHAIAANDSLDQGLIMTNLLRKPAFGPILATSPHLGAPLATALARLPDQRIAVRENGWYAHQVLKALAANPASPPEVLAKALEDPRSQANAVANPSTPRDVLAKMALSRTTQAALAAALGSSPEVLADALATSDDPWCTHASRKPMLCVLGHFLGRLPVRPVARQSPSDLRSRLNAAHARVVELSAHHEGEFARDALDASRVARDHLVRQLEVTALSGDGDVREVEAGIITLEELGTALGEAARVDHDLAGAKSRDDLELVTARANALRDLGSAWA